MLIRFLNWLVQLSLFRRDKTPSNYRDIIAWWEIRRLPYNGLVGVTGIVSATIVFATAFLAERYLGEAIGLPDPPWLAILATIAYGVMANVCFTGGWILELISRRVWEGRSDAFGEIAFLWGTLFSIALTLLPAALVVLLVAIRLFERR